MTKKGSRDRSMAGKREGDRSITPKEGIQRRRFLPIYLVLITSLVLSGPRAAYSFALESEADAPDTQLEVLTASEPETVQEPAQERQAQYSLETIPLERGGIQLHLSCMKLQDSDPEKNILLIHGLTYSSHEFDINYQDYSLVRRLAREGYAVWRLDISGYGESGKVEDGFMPDSDYAAEDIEAAVRAITSLTGQEKIDLLGWSWGTVTSSRFISAHPELVNRYVMYAPILCGLGAADIEEPFHSLSWEHAASDFQFTADGQFDLDITDPVVIDLYCASCWHYDGEKSPNGGRKDLCVPESEMLIDLDAIQVPTLVICGTNDPYLNFDLVNASLEHLPENSRLEIIEGGAHAIMYEKPYYHDFQDRLMAFLEE